MIVKLLVLVVLALSLGDSRDSTQVIDEVAMLDVELTDAPDMVIIPHAIVRSVPNEVGVLPEITVSMPRSRDAGRVFRPPRVV